MEKNRIEEYLGHQEIKDLRSIVCKKVLKPITNQLTKSIYCLIEKENEVFIIEDEFGIEKVIDEDS